MNDPELPPSTLRLRIDAQALADNWRALDRMSGSAAAGAAVKADAYGLGVSTVAPILRDAGVRDFFVAHWSEVPPLLTHVPPAHVCVLHGPVIAADAAFASATGVRPVINSVHQAQVWRDAGGGVCDLMIDSGINRLGIPPGALGDPAVAGLTVDTVMSHLASADEDGAQNQAQLALFEQVANTVPARRRSLANSAGIVLGRAYAFDLTRPGLALYGGVPRRELAGVIRQVAHPQAAVLQLRDLSPGDSVGYNALFTADRPLRAATVSLGYADGFLRAWTGKGALRFAGADLPLLGRVSMDMVVVDVSAAPAIREGDWLDVPYTLLEAAKLTGLSQYELLTLLGRRFVRSN
ncbi:MAG: alanine racemase [Croceibacterium sp.]